jgi:glucokinase
MLAEAAAGAASELTDAILLAIGTGIGSAVLSDGRIVRGYRGSATSFGWACAAPEDRGDAVHGWLERVISGTALDRLAQRIGLESGAALVAAARRGEETALAILDEPATALGTALAGAVALLGSQAIIISGGVAEALDVIAPTALDALRRQVPVHLRGVRLIRAALGPAATLTGAGIAARGHALWTESTR